MITLAAKNLIVERQKSLRDKVGELKTGRAPHLAVVLVGSDPASQVYVSKKGAAAEAVNFTHETIVFGASATPEEVHQKVKSLNLDPKVDGILIQRPLPRQFKEEEVVYWVQPKKDVDCLHPENVGLLVSGKPRFAPCTPGGIMVLLDYYQIPVAGKIACVVGRSAIVGKPLAALLLSKNASVIQIHRGTVNPEALCKQADLVFAAAGSRGLITADWIKEGAVVVDVGIHRGENGKLTGDVDAESVKGKVSALSPVPGGVGPLTIQILLENTYLAHTLNLNGS